MVFRPVGDVMHSSDEQLRRRTSIKWSRAGAGIIAADIAELDFDVAPPVADVVRWHLTHHDFGYPDFSDGTPRRLAEVFAGRMERIFQWSPAVDRVELCGQIMQALCCAILAYTDVGDSVLTHAPTYAPIGYAVNHLGRRLVTIPVRNLRDSADLRACIGGQNVNMPMRLIVLCQPHNPTGHVFDLRTLDVLAEFAGLQGAVVFSDEIYQDLVYLPVEYHSAGAVDGLGDRSLIFTSAGKSFNIGGLRCAVGHFGSRRLHEVYCRLPWHLRDGASLLGINATIAAWEDGGEWLSCLRAQLTRNRAAVVEAFKGSSIVRCPLPLATYLAWLDMRESRAAPDPRGFLLQRARVAVQPGAAFGPGFEGFARLNFGTSEGRLRDMLNQILRAVSAAGPG